jgi:hypothetical protein
VKFHSADAMAFLYFLRNAHIKIKRRTSLKNEEEREGERRKVGVVKDTKFKERTKIFRL